MSHHPCIVQRTIEKQFIMCTGHLKDLQTFTLAQGLRDRLLKLVHTSPVITGGRWKVLKRDFTVSHKIDRLFCDMHASRMALMGSSGYKLSKKMDPADSFMHEQMH